MSTRELTGKLAARGVSSLSDDELLALLLDEEEPLLGRQLLEACGGSLAALVHEELPRLRMVAGLGLRRAARLQAAGEFGRRIAAQQAEQTVVITTSDDVVRLFRPQLEHLPHEECWSVYLSSSNRILERQRISQGGVQSTVVDHRLIVKRALELLATQMILVHNHPSGTAEPSEADRIQTRRLAEAAALFDIRLLDHIIIARAGDYSFLRAGAL